jgi:DNA sulfur modification protein DndD
MKINKLSLYNFNSFEGLNEFDFTNDDPDKNIILIGGKNGAGKTSLFSAIKIALFGPLAFGYIGINPHYIAKIKDCINMKAFQQRTVESYVQLTLSLMVEREVKKYEITRSWDYSKQKLEETYSVKENGNDLDAQELSYFQNYLQGLIPPDLFEFFLFDGEEVGSVFSTSSYNSYVKNAIYTLCGLDVFEIIRKYTKGYIGKAASEAEETVHSEYEQLCREVEQLSEQAIETEKLVAEKNARLEELDTEIIELETAFKNAGGITEKERKRLAKEFDESEHIKSECTAKIKLFVEGLMPFYILKDFTPRISNQLDFEEKGEIYNYIQLKLNKDELRSVLEDIEGVPADLANTLFAIIVEKFRPKGYVDGCQPMHDLSREDSARVQGVMSMIEDFDADDMVGTIEKRKAASDRTAEINRILKEAMAEEDATTFAEKHTRLYHEKDELLKEIYKLQEECSSIQSKKDSLTAQRDRLLQTLKDKAQNRHVIDLSTGLSNMMESLLSHKTESFKNDLETRIVKNLSYIYRKDNLITHIEIEDSFQFNLYQNATYKIVDIINLLNNVGKDSFLETIGHRGEVELFRIYGVDSLKKLQQVIKVENQEKELELYKRIDISRLSKGERQIFILSLYWAIIELSGKDIPFVIDTPYARIDANHRKEISEKFFPNISKQVIILSTDEEINSDYYGILKPYIAREYLLVNDESQNRTSVENHYFFGE